VRSLFQALDDCRLSSVVAALERIRSENERLFAQIAEIDFSDTAEIALYLTSTDAVFQATVDDFYTQVMKLAAVQEAGLLTSDGNYKLWYDDVVIRKK
jgi:hypothetical protein